MSSTIDSPNRRRFRALLQRIRSTILGYDRQTEMLVLTLAADGHASLLGEPGTGKTKTLRCLGAVVGDAVYQRIQFKPDLQPADIEGCEVYLKDTGEFEFREGPLNPRVNILHADEINRTPPRTQSALLEPMDERQFTVAGNTATTFRLHDVFMVVSTRNPIDTEGVYTLPVAEMDRFAVEIVYDRLEKAVERRVVQATTFNRHGESRDADPVLTVSDILAIRQEMGEAVYVSDAAYDYAHELAFATRPEECPEELKGVLKAGVSVRAMQWTVRLAHARAFMRGGDHVTADDIRFVVPDVFRHRLAITEQAELRAWVPERVIDIILKKVPVVSEV